MKLLVLAGGFGTRLSQHVRHVPKPLAPIGDVPFLHYQIDNWVTQGVSSFVFLLHHKADLINHFIDQQRSGLLSGCEVNSITEPIPLDTGGSIANAIKKLGLSGQFMVANADTWLGLGVQSLIKAGADSITVVKQPDVSPYGHIEFDDQGFVQAFYEKGQKQFSGWINAGLCALHSEHFRKWDGLPLSLERSVLPNLLINKGLRAITVSSDFIDIGIPENYERFCQWQLNGRSSRLCN